MNQTQGSLPDPLLCPKCKKPIERIVKPTDLNEFWYCDEHGRLRNALATIPS